MGIIDDMENFILDHFSVIKRHNVQQTFEVTSSGGQQMSLQEQVASEEVSRQELGGQRSQVMTQTRQDQVSGAHSRPRSLNGVSTTAATQISRRVEHSSRSERGSISSETSDVQRSPPVERSAVPSSPFRERISWSDHSEAPLNVSDFHMSPHLEYVGATSPFRSRQRVSWVEQSSSSLGSVGQKRNFSKEHVTTSPVLSSHFSTSSEHQSEYGPINSNDLSDHRRTSASDSLPPSSPIRSERHRASHHSDNVPPTSPFRCDCRSPISDQAAINPFSHEQQDIEQAPHGNCTQHLIKHSIDVSVAIFAKPKLVRLRSEPCAFSSLTTDNSVRGPQQDRSASCRRREDLKRSQSFEVTSPSHCETLWTGINVPSQLVITRPQLLGSRLNRKHLSLHLEGGAGDLNSVRSDPPLQFHDTHGDNIELLNNKTRARRHESFCKGICFSNRSISVNEKVYIKFVETNTSWSGVLRFGFTSVDPKNIQGCDLPRYACPDLTNKPGNWAKALGERYTASNILLHFSVNRAGDVIYGVNGEEKGLFFSGVVTSQPLWALLDIYGNTVAVEFSHANAEIEHPASAFDASPQNLDCNLFNFPILNLNGAQGSQTSTVAAASSSHLIYWHADVSLSPLYLHNLLGRNVLVGTDCSLATRLEHEYCNGYVFTSRPVCYGETLVIQVLEIDRSFIGGLGFGLTACDPGQVDRTSLPDDSDLLLDRPEYWVVNKDVCRNPEVGDELSFYISDNGEVRYARNNHTPVTLMHVDRTLPLWAFFDIFGNIKKIKLLGTTMTPCQGRLPRSQSTNSYSNVPLSSVSSSGGATGGTASLSGATSPKTPGTPGSTITDGLQVDSIPASNSSSSSRDNTDEASFICSSSLPSTPLSPTSQVSLEEETTDCKVCWERVINCALYTCGHMCLCFDCATTIRREKGLCPICRQPIVDVIKIYKS